MPRAMRALPISSPRTASTSTPTTIAATVTTAPDAPLGRFADRAGGAKVIADVAAVHDLIADRHPGLPVILFGHSMGGIDRAELRAAPLGHASMPPRSGTPISRPGCSAGSAQAHACLGTIPAGLRRAVAPAAETHLPGLGQGRAQPPHPVRLAVARPGRGATNTSPTRSAAGMPRFRCGATFSASIFDGADDRNFRRRRRDLPFHLVGGEKDPATDDGKAISDLAGRMRRMGFSNLVSKIYAETRHESLNEVNRDIIMERFRRLGRRRRRPNRASGGLAQRNGR